MTIDFLAKFQQNATLICPLYHEDLIGGVL